jgi:hypothetical protein
LCSHTKNIYEEAKKGREKSEVRPHPHPTMNTHKKYAQNMLDKQTIHNIKQTKKCTQNMLHKEPKPSNTITLFHSHITQMMQNFHSSLTP